MYYMLFSFNLQSPLTFLLVIHTFVLKYFPQSKEQDATLIQKSDKMTVYIYIPDYNFFFPGKYHLKCACILYYEGIAVFFFFFFPKISLLKSGRILQPGKCG
jgi:hypothetical protein